MNSPHGTDEGPARENRPGSGTPNTNPSAKPEDSLADASPARNPLLDDPLFADFVSDSSVSEALPVALPVEDSKAPIVARRARPVLDEDLPIATPVAPKPLATPVRSTRGKRLEAAAPTSSRPFPLDPDSAPPTLPHVRDELPTDTRLPRRKILQACGAIGCLMIGFIGVLAFLAYVAIFIISHLGNTMKESGSQTPLIGGYNYARLGPVAPTSLKSDTTIKLPAAFDAVGRAAGGRFLLLRIPSQKEIAIFDPNEGKVVRTINIEEPKALFAGSASKLFVYLPDSGSIERWDLGNGTREKREAKPLDLLDADALTVGAGSDGPLVLITNSNGLADFRVFDEMTLQQTEFYKVPGLSRSSRLHVRSSNDGTLLGLMGNQKPMFVRLSPGSAPRFFGIEGDLAKVSVPIPSPDGSYCYTSKGFFRTDAPPLNITLNGTGFTIPTDQGDGLFMSLKNSLKGRVEGPLSIHLAGKPNPIAVLDSVAIPRLSTDSVDVTTDQRVHLWPAAGLAAVLPPSNDSIKLTKINIEDALKETGTTFAIVGSDPPTGAERGRVWGYKPEVWISGDRDYSLQLKKAPPGMKITRLNQLEWAPTQTDLPAYDVQFDVTRPKGATLAVQSFRLVVTDTK